MKKYIYFVLCMLLANWGVQAQIDRSVQPKPGPSPKINLTKPYEFQLSNGLTVLVVENHKLPRVSYTLTIDNPPVSEGEKSGISSLLGSMLGNGTTSISKDAFNEEVDFLGANINYNAFGARASALSKYRERILAMMADGALNPVFDQEEFEKVKKQQIEGVKSSEKSVEEIASRIGPALAYGTNHPYGEFVSEESLNKIELEDVKTFYNQYYKPNNAYLIVIGDVNSKKIKKAVKKHFKSWKKSDNLNITVPKAKENVNSSEINFVDMPNAVQSNISITNNIDLKMSDKDYHAALITNKIFGGGFNSYLNMNLREKHGYTYGARSVIGAGRYASRFRAGAAVRNVVTDSAVVQTLKEIERIKTTEVAPDALANAKAKYLGDFVLAMENPATIANYALNIKRNNLPEDFYSTYLEKINSVSAQDVKRIANTYFKPENARFVVIGKGSEVIENLEKVGLPIKYYTTKAEATKKPEFSIPLPKDITANKVLQQYIDAIGGMDKLREVNSVLVKAEAELQPGMMIEMDLRKTNKKQMKLELKAMGQVVSKQLLNGEKAYMEAQGQRKDLAGIDLEKMQAESSPFPEVNLLGGGAVLEKIEKVNGTAAYRVKLSDEKTAFYDVKTGLKLKEAQKQGPMVIEMFLTNYKEVFGIQFPFKLTQSMGPRKFDFNVTEIKVNEGVNKEDFN